MARDLPTSVESNAFVRAEKIIYPTEIRINHWQLRHYISSPEPNIIYFASLRNISCLNTITHKCTHVATLPFSVRCFAAGHGYLCAGGGDAGDFAIIRPDAGWAAEVGALLPLNLGSNESTQKELVPEVKNFGSDIVNSVSIHKLKDPDTFVRDDIVAVITSNDHIVRILSLTQGYIETAALDMPFAVNHATISPDGETLVAVGDYQQAYFYERAYSPSDRSRSLGGHASSMCSWDLLNIIMLHVPKPMILTGYFTTAWSPSSRLCAVASECGYITIIDMERLKDFENGEEAIVAVLPGTRPETQAGPGAIRTLMFSPAPWDLLAWAEDQGRVVVADLRDSCRAQQLLKLDQNGEYVKKIVFDAPIPSSNDRSEDTARIARDYESMQRYLDQYEQSSTERRRIEQQLVEIRRENGALSDVIMSAGSGGDNDLPSYLDLREMSVLNSLRTTQDVMSRPAYSALMNTIRLERDRDLSNRPRSIQYRPSELGGRRNGLSRDDDFPALTRSRANADGGNDDLDERFRIIRDYIRRPLGSHNGSDSERTIQSVRSLLYPGRRDAPLTLTNTEIESLLDQAASDSSRRNTSDSAPSPRAAVPPRESSAGPSPSSSARRRQQLERIHATHRASASAQRDAAAAQASSGSGSSSSSGSTARDAWAAHRAPSASASPVDPALARHPSAAVSPRATDLALTARAARESLARQARLDRAAPHAHAHAAAAAAAAAAAIRSGVGDPAYGVLTAGLAWSEDGGRLWVGCEEGIWEFDVDVKGRMGFSAVEMR